MCVLLEDKNKLIGIRVWSYCCILEIFLKYAVTEKENRASGNN